MRVSALVGALLGWFALLLQLYLMLVQSPAGALAMVGTVITYFSFFTILTNFLVALVFTAAVFSSGSGRPATGWGVRKHVAYRAGLSVPVAKVP
jgi:hypothetical protein